MRGLQEIDRMPEASSPYDQAPSFEEGGDGWVKARACEAVKVLATPPLSDRDQPAGYRCPCPRGGQ